MMAKTVYKESICDVCGAEVRDGSVFCYNCGSAVTQGAIAEEAASPPVETELSEGSASPEEPSIGHAVRADEKILPGSRRTEKFRPKRKPLQSREVSWQEPEGVSVSFIVTTLVMVALAAGILIAGFYLR